MQEMGPDGMSLDLDIDGDGKPDTSLCKICLSACLILAFGREVLPLVGM